MIKLLLTSFQTINKSFEGCYRIHNRTNTYSDNAHNIREKSILLFCSFQALNCLTQSLYCCSNCCSSPWIACSCCRWAADAWDGMPINQVQSITMLFSPHLYGSLSSNHTTNARDQHPHGISSLTWHAHLATKIIDFQSVIRVRVNMQNFNVTTSISIAAFGSTVLEKYSVWLLLVHRDIWDMLI